jgi:ATP adenylyltransferase
MDQIWAPWRMKFILQGEHKGCFLCDKPKEDKDRENLLLYRGKENYILLNAYPYNPGHLMVTTYRHLGSMDAFTESELKEHFELVRLAIRLLTKVLSPAGYNVGMNLGKIAGAGVADHIHTHIVPRWQGDTNFMPVVAETKVLSEGLEDTYDKLLKGLKGLI